MHQTQGKVNFEFARQHADGILRITLKHGLEEPRFVDYPDAKFDLTILVRAKDETSLLDVTAAMTELEEFLNRNVFIITEEEFSKHGQEVPFYAIVRTA